MALCDQHLLSVCKLNGDMFARLALLTYREHPHRVMLRLCWQSTVAGARSSSSQEQLLVVLHQSLQVAASSDEHLPHGGVLTCSPFCPPCRQQCSADLQGCAS
jgi:hypothetical protein